MDAAELDLVAEENEAELLAQLNYLNLITQQRQQHRQQEEVDIDDVPEREMPPTQQSLFEPFEHQQQQQHGPTSHGSASDASRGGSLGGQPSVISNGRLIV